MKDPRIIFPLSNGSVALGHPIPSEENPVENIAKNTTPKGVPYRIIEYSDLPLDHDFFEAWEADFSKPDGIGEGPIYN